MRLCCITSILVLILTAIAVKGVAIGRHNPPATTTTAPDTRRLVDLNDCPVYSFVVSPDGRIVSVSTQPAFASHITKSMIFVCGAGGAMNGRKLEIVKDELKHEISRMRPIQSFNTIFYQETQDNLGYTAFKPKLVPVNPGNASAMEAYLTGVVASGPRSPIKALDEAFTECPEQIYFLTDGEFDNPGGPNDTQVLACIRQKNAAHKIRINTVLFVQNLKEANSSEEVTKMLTIVAKENGGKFKLILVDDFQKTLGQPDKHD